MVTENKNDTIVFWGCFIALITTSFVFIGRVFLAGTWQADFNLDDAQTGRLIGIGIWPFAVSIIGFSLIIDKIGYKKAMYFAFAGHITWAVMAIYAYFVKDSNPTLGFNLLYWGSLIVALANGTVEAFINPVVATMFSKEKTKWLNILHAGWPGGLVAAGIITIFIDDLPWWVKVGLLAIPALIYLVMLIPCKFPVSERVSSGVSYREMLSEFGVMGAAVVSFLITLQLMDFFQVDSSSSPTLFWAFVGLGVAMVAAFGLYTRSLGRPLMLVLVLIMMPLATTEIGTDGWITGIMEGVAEGKFHPGWILVYTSAIMLVLRFFAGPIVHALSPLGLLCVSAILAIIGLATLSFTQGMMILLAATLYGFGKTFFWPTMLGVVSEQTPKGGALTLNAISGIGMLAVGTLGFPYIGTLQSDKQIQAVSESDEAEKVTGLVEDGKLTVLEDKSIYEIIKYQAIDDAKLNRAILDTVVAKQKEEDRTAFQAAVETLPKEEKNPDDPDKPINKQEQLLGEIAKVPFGSKKSVDEFAEGLKGKDKDAVDAAVAAIVEPKTEKEIEQLVGKLSEEQKETVQPFADERKALNELILAIPEASRDPVTQMIGTIAEDQGAIKTEIKGVRDRADQQALMNMTVFPAIMLIGYVLLIFYFRSRGGYDAQQLDAKPGKPEKPDKGDPT